MNCDICGLSIVGRASNVLVEGAKLSVCRKCAPLGKPYQEPPQRLSGATRRTAASPAAKRSQPVAPKLPKEVEAFDVASDFPQQIQRARRNLGWSQEDLAMRIKEKLSVVKKLESGKMNPDLKLAKILEHTLRLKILTPKEEVPVTSIGQTAKIPLTLGDVVKIRRKASKDL